jgi:hypothetical protein
MDSDYIRRPGAPKGNKNAKKPENFKKSCFFGWQLTPAAYKALQDIAFARKTTKSKIVEKALQIAYPQDFPSENPPDN